MKKSNFLRVTTAIFVGACLSACSKSPETAESVNPSAAKTEAKASAADDYWICIGDSEDTMLRAYDPNDTNWNDSGSTKWAWEPTTARGFTSGEIAAFGGGTDWKIRRNTTWGGTGQVLAVTSNRFAALAEYGFPHTDKGRKLWCKYWPTVTEAGNVHSAEVLPNGNIAVAASDGNWVRVYNTTTASSSNYAQYNLEQAHGVLWDPTLSKLWVIGRLPGTVQCIITALNVGGTRSAPTLSEDLSRRLIFPSGGIPHDVYPYYGDTNKLWVACNSKVWIYNKSTKTATDAPASVVNLQKVKSIGNQPSGQIVVAFPNGTTACASTHVTNTVTFFNPSMSRQVTGQCTYKARVLALPYQ